MSASTLSASDQIAAWRADTPGVAHRNHLNNAGAALMPQPVIDAITDHVKLESEIGGYEAADTRAAEIASGYDALAELIGARAENVAVVGSATAGFVQSLSSFDFKPGDVIVTTHCDYTSNQIQYLALRSVNQLQRDGRTGQLVAVHDCGSADSRPFVENLPQRHILRDERDSTVRNRQFQLARRCDGRRQ